MSQMPVQKPGKSVQSVATPPKFIQAISTDLKIEFCFDLAADESNCIISHDGLKNHYDEADNALVQPWNADHMPNGWRWCNPPFSDLPPWVAKAAYETFISGAHIGMLVPASIGSNWWAEFVHGIAYVIALRPRLTFVGHKNPYPKDLALLLYAPFLMGGYRTWDWKK